MLDVVNKVYEIEWNFHYVNQNESLMNKCLWGFKELERVHIIKEVIMMQIEWFLLWNSSRLSICPHANRWLEFREQCPGLANKCFELKHCSYLAQAASISHISFRAWILKIKSWRNVCERSLGGRFMRIMAEISVLFSFFLSAYIWTTNNFSLKQRSAKN